MFMLKISLHPTEGCIVIDKHLFTSRLSSSFFPPSNCFSANTVHPPARHQKRLVCAPAGIKGRGPTHRLYSRFVHPHSFPGRAHSPRPTPHPLSGKGILDSLSHIPLGARAFPRARLRVPGTRGKPRPLGRERGGAASPPQPLGLRAGLRARGRPRGSLSPRRGPQPAPAPVPHTPGPTGSPSPWQRRRRGPCA